MEKAQVVVVVVPFVAQGHLNQLFHLARLLSYYNLPVHIVGTTTHSRQAKLRIHGWDDDDSNSANTILLHEYQTPEFEIPPPNPNLVTKFPSHLIPSIYASNSLREPFVELLASISTNASRVIVIHDYLMSSVVQDVISFPNAEAYAFHCASAFNLFSYVWERKTRPYLDDHDHDDDDDESHDMQLLKIPTPDDGIPLDFIQYIMSQEALCMTFNSGNLHDTSKVIEGKFIDYLCKEEICGSTKHWAMGPFNPVKIISDAKNLRKRHSSLEWLDKQVQDSVLYVSFGTTTSLSDEQVQELAIGLENSGQKFIWVLRDADKGDIFKGDDQARRVDHLPKGFETRLEEFDKGMVVREWAPQLEILAHRATGGFMSHCGWNSSMESITMGVPIAAWPMHSDQPRNATLITDVLKIGITLGDWERRSEVVTSINIEKTIRKLMASEEGNEMRKRATKLGEDVRSSMEKGGVTRIVMDSFVSHITR